MDININTKEPKSKYKGLLFSAVLGWVSTLESLVIGASYTTGERRKEEKPFEDKKVEQDENSHC